MRTLPYLKPETTPFWTGGRDGLLMITRCQQCRRYLHPPAPICKYCKSRDVRPEAVSGRATVMTFTINYHPWTPQLEVPYVIAVVDLEEQENLHLTTNIVNCSPEDVFIGMKVKVTFEQQDDVFLPLFEPC